MVAGDGTPMLELLVAEQRQQGSRQQDSRRAAAGPKAEQAAGPADVEDSEESEGSDESEDEFSAGGAAIETADDESDAFSPSGQVRPFALHPLAFVLIPFAPSPLTGGALPVGAQSSRDCPPGPALRTAASTVTLRAG